MGAKESTERLPSRGRGGLNQATLRLYGRVRVFHQVSLLFGAGATTNPTKNSQSEFDKKEKKRIKWGLGLWLGHVCFAQWERRGLDRILRLAQLSFLFILFNSMLGPSLSFTTGLGLGLRDDLVIYMPKQSEICSDLEMLSLLYTSSQSLVTTDEHHFIELLIILERESW